MRDGGWIDGHARLQLLKGKKADVATYQLPERELTHPSFSAVLLEE
jgi:hypothetical protein